MLAIVPSRWTSASSPPWWPSPTTGRSRRPPAPCSRCSRTSPATSPGWRRSSARRSSTGPRAASPTTAPRVVERARRILRELDDIAADVAPRRRRRHRRRPHRHPRDDGPLAAPRPAHGAVDGRTPDVRAIVSEGSTSVLLPALLGGRFNAAIVHLPVDDPELTIEPLFAEDLLLVAHADHPLAGRGEMPSPSSPTHRLLLPPAGSALRRVLDRAAALGRRPAPGAGRDRRRPPARHAGRRRPRRGDRPGDRGPRGGRRRLRRRSGCPSCRRASSPSPTSAGPAERAGAGAVRGPARRRRRPAPPTSPASASAPTRSRSADPLIRSTSI